LTWSSVWNVNEDQFISLTEKEIRIINNNIHGVGNDDGLALDVNTISQHLPLKYVWMLMMKMKMELEVGGIGVEWGMVVTVALAVTNLTLASRHCHTQDSYTLQPQTNY